MKNKSYFLFIPILFITISCRKIPKTPLTEQELITTLQLNFIDTTFPNTSYKFSFTDLDGDGGIQPLLDTIQLPKGKTYFLNLLLLDERNYPADTINLEIEELDFEHQFFFQSIPLQLLQNIQYLDEDDNGMPVGLQSQLNTIDSISTGFFRVTLRHLPDKFATNVAQGDITNANGETDIEIDFPIKLY